ncbi:MAG TPA: AAA family ATPase [Candidatus Limnocylindrales bacterium]|nr:AAA family ATPase [Candidatus Limnocylindrales bacterium]
MFGTLFNQKKEEENGNDQASSPIAADTTVQSAAPVDSQFASSPQSLGGNSPVATDPVVQTATPVPAASIDSIQQNQTPTNPPIGLSQSPIVSTPVPAATEPQVASPTPSPSSPAERLDTSALSHLDPRAGQVLTHAQEETRRTKQQFIEPAQVLFGLLYDEQVYGVLGEAQVDGGALSKEIQSKETMGVFRGQPALSKTAQGVFDQAFKDAKMRGSNFVSPEDILIALFDPSFGVASLLESRGLKKEAFVEKVAKNPNLNYSKKTILEKYGVDLNAEALAGKLDPIAGRDAEIDRMVHILLRRTKNNPIIIGETGVGKTAIVEGLAQKIVSGQIPKDLQDKRVFQLDVASLVAGASHRGEFEERLRGVINEVTSSGNKIILFIDEIHALLGTGDGEGMNAANIIKPHLARGHLQLIGATTTIEYRKNFEKDKAFERRFQPVTADEPSEENAFEMLKVIRPKYEKFHRVTISDDTLMECVKLSKKYIGERYLPDKAVDLLDEAGSEVKLQSDEGKRGDTQVKKTDIESVVSGWTGIPITKLTEDESEKLLKLEDRIHHRLIDQMEAVVAVSEAVRRGRIGLAAANRPIASFVFLGPTGVGKTELAKTLAELLFGRDDAMARLDMSEYMEKHEVAKLIGAPPGYVGYEEGGQLTEAVRKKPYSIVLFDEIEKAHPDVFNLLLQLLEDGRLTDNKGNTISFKNTIVICTSNIGSALIQEQLSHIDANTKKTPEETAKTFKELTETVKGELIKFFRPELLNRFDEVVVFKPLAQEHMAGIARLGIAKTAGLLKEQGFNLQISEKGIERLAKDGYDPVYGARPLRRLIQTAIENPIALEIISKHFVAGDTIVVDYSETTNEFVFTKGNGVLDITSNLKKTLLEINHSEKITDPSKKDQYIRLHDSLSQASAQGNTVAAAILKVDDNTPEEAITKIEEDLKLAKEKGDQLAIDILGIATTQSVKEAEVVHAKEPVTKFKNTLKQIINPLYLAIPANKDRFSKLYDRLNTATQENNAIAKSILAITDISSDSDIQQLKEQLEKAKTQGDPLAIEILDTIAAGIKTEEVSKLKDVLLLIVNPITAQIPKEREKFTELRTKISATQQSGNVLAGTILSINDATTDDALLQLKTQLEDAKAHNDEVANLVLDAVAGVGVVEQPQAAPQDPAANYPFGTGQQPVTTQLTPDPSTGAALQQANASSVAQAVGQASGPLPQAPVQSPAFVPGSGFSALNEILQRDTNIISNAVESDGENIA